MPGRRVALLVATSAHIDQNLPGGGVSAADGSRLRDLLLAPDVGSFDEVTLVVNESKSGIEREVERLLRGRAPEDTVLLHMSGRAVWNDHGQLFFATVGTDVTMPYSTAVPAVVLRQLLAECPAEQQIVLLDCGIGDEPNLAKHLGDGAFLIAASGELTATVIRGLDTGEADITENGEITVRELYGFIRYALPDERWQVRTSGVSGDTRIANARTRTTVQPVSEEAAQPEVRPELLALLGFPGMVFDVQEAWRRRPPNEMFRVPIGADEKGHPVQLDIKVGPDGGMGLHGLLVGADDATRAELLQSIVVGLAATHSSDTVNFVLLDCSGEDTLAPVANLPHVSALLTAGDDKFVGRLSDALAGEVSRRQEMVHAGKFRSVWDYQEARDKGVEVGGQPLDPLPALVVVVDGLTELISAHPRFVETLVLLGRLGKTMRIHLLLSSARLEKGDLRGLDHFLAYRIVLKTDTPADSRAVLGVPDAYDLPRGTGAAYLKFGVQEPVRFTTATMSGDDDAPPLPEQLATRMYSHGPPAHEMWLPPLDTPNPLDHLVPPLHINEERGLCPQNTPWLGQLKTPVGVVDKPFEHRRDLLWLDFSAEAGHGVVVGGPQSGKSTLLRTLTMSMALTHTPQEAQFYCLDFGGGTLATLRDLPHVVAVASATDRDLARQIVDLLSSLITRREQQFRAQGIDSMATFRDRKRQGQVADDPDGDVFLLVDGDPGEFDAQVQDLVTQGLPYGVHVILTANRWADIRPELSQLLGTRLELRLADPAESEADARVAVHVPTRPGFGVTRDKLHFLAGLPRFDGSSSVEDLDEASRAAAVRILNSRRTPMPDNELVRQHTSRTRGMKRIQIGVHDPGFQPVFVDFQAEPHLLALGDPVGKTNLLRAVLRGLTQRYTESEAAVLLVDYRRGLFEFAEAPHLLRYAVMASELTEWTVEVVDSLRKRVPGPWTGPELFVVVDDYDLVATREGNPLLPLLEFLPKAREIGLHMIVASRSGGHPQDPIVTSLKEAVSPGVLMNANSRPGHAVMVTRESGQRPVQLTWTEPQRQTP